MTTEGLARLRTAARSYQRAKAVADARRDELFGLIAESAKAGQSQKDIVEATGFTREHVRRILRERGVKADPSRVPGGSVRASTPVRGVRDQDVAE